MNKDSQLNEEIHEANLQGLPIQKLLFPWRGGTVFLIHVNVFTSLKHAKPGFCEAFIETSSNKHINSTRSPISLSGKKKGGILHFKLLTKLIYSMQDSTNHHSIKFKSTGVI